jgi:hypothetical protein
VLKRADLERWTAEQVARSPTSRSTTLWGAYATFTGYVLVGVGFAVGIVVTFG